MRNNKVRLLAIILSLVVLFSGCSLAEQVSDLLPQSLVEGLIEDTTSNSVFPSDNNIIEFPKRENSAAGQSVETDSSASEGGILDSIPPFDGETPYEPLNGNIPDFSEIGISTEAYEYYSELDALGRCGACYGCMGQELMPTEERGDISSVYPTGWVQNEYDFIDGGWLLNRSHLIGFQIAGENDNEKNLIAGTRYFNVNGMLPFEDMVADYIRETNNHVMYYVKPIFEGDDLMCRGVQMQAYSVEDEGESVCFNVFVYNVQPGVDIDYSTGENWANGEETDVYDPFYDAA